MPVDDAPAPLLASVIAYVPVAIPEHLPPRLTITLWDFSWFVRTGPGEPFENLERAVVEAKARGYNTVRICAMPFLLFGSGLDTSAVSVDRLGGEYAQGVRWYDVAAPSVFDGRAHLLRLFRALRAHDMFAIVSSWEYQQSSSFSTTSDWWDALEAVDPDDRPSRLAHALADLHDFLDDAGLSDRIALTELHNEVQFGHLTAGLDAGPDAGPDGLSETDAVLALRPRLERGLDEFHRRHPTRPVTVNYAHVPIAAMRGIPANIDALVVHPYVYGVLDEVTAAFDLRGDLAAFPRAAVEAVGLLRAGAPDAVDWVLPDDVAWKMRATIVGKPEIFLHDWVDASAFDRFLYGRYQAHATEMARILGAWLDVAADFSAHRGIPLVFGEGWIGYTPRDGDFEEGPIGAAFCRLAIRESHRVGAWGTIVCSNAAPQHRMWADVALQRECNEAFLGGDASALRV